MKNVLEYHRDMDIQKRAFRILLREMGLAETLRFNVTKEGVEYFKDTTVSEPRDEINRIQVVAQLAHGL